VIKDLEGNIKELHDTMKVKLENKEQEVVSMMLQCTFLEEEKSKFAEKEAIICEQEQQINSLKAVIARQERDCLQHRITIDTQAARLLQILSANQGQKRELDEIRLRFYVHICMS